MFEAVELGRKIPKADYARQLPILRARLIEAQLAVRKARFPVIIIVTGLDGAGKGVVVHHLNEWLDPRGIDNHSFWKLTEEDRERPYFWRFWRALPAGGRIGIFFGGWYADLLDARVSGSLESAPMDRELGRIAALEQMLVEDGALVVKFWFHLSRKAQRKRFRELAKNPEDHLQQLSLDRKRLKRYPEFVRAAEQMIRRTDTGYAPWHLIESADGRYRDLTAGRLLLEAIQARLSKETARVVPAARPRRNTAPARRPATTVLDRVDLTQSVGKEQYEKRLEKVQLELSRLAWKAYDRRTSSVLVFEGWDAAGKGSAIRRVTEAIDARLYRVIPVAAPTEEERAHHYLWRFWRHLPRAGMVAIFDRSWYGRLLVERVEGFARPDEWMRAYHEINEFEKQLVEHGVVLLKFWIHISKDEQMRRFRKREEVAHKNYKITAEDWRNRKQWGAYEHAVHDMVTRTSTAEAPWTLVAGNDKRYARLQILETFCRRLKKAL